MVRPQNEDAYLIADLGEQATSAPGTTETLSVAGTPVCLIVADGVGGAASGEIASIMATDAIVTALRREYASGAIHSVATAERAMLDAMASANQTIYNYALNHSEHQGMATTATLALAYDAMILLAQVGDSRAYVAHNGAAYQVTKDQSLVQQMIDAGELSEEEAHYSDRRNIILQALGSEPIVLPDMYRVVPGPGDVLLLCSDGLSNHLSTDDIARLAYSDPDVATVCTNMIASANARGGYDNITVIASRFVLLDIAVTAITQESTSPGFVGRVRRWLQ
jgi:serine/threonine protein phosphatase PrpC